MLRSILVAIFGMASLFADEGMWTFDAIPLSKISSKYGVKLSKEQIDQMRLSSLRVSLGGSASFVSRDGLVLTNHHVAYKAIDNLSTKDQNFIERGFYAETRDKELPCPNVHVDQLISIQDITDEASSDLIETMTVEEKEVRRKEKLALIKDNAEKSSGYHAEIVTLFKGAKYHLYLYKRYTDVRLVMAPEQNIAFFGGDEMNFEFPRMNLDFAFLRVYENGKPLQTEHYFKWSHKGPVEGEVLFVIGNPGSTTRIFTSDHLKWQRDYNIPLTLKFIEERTQLLEAFGEKDKEYMRQAQAAHKTLKNSEKVLRAELKGLKETKLINAKEKQEKKLFSELAASDVTAWKTLKENLEQNEEFTKQYAYVERLSFLFSKTYASAKQLVRFAKERNLPSEKRLKEYAESEIPALERQLFSLEPVYEPFEACILGEGIQNLISVLGESHPLVKQIKSGPSAEQIAAQTKLYSVEFRKELYENPELIFTSEDPLIQLAIMIDPFARELREKFENQYEAVSKECYTKIATLLFNHSKGELYPDATFTPRLSFGTMKGYRQDGAWIKPTSNIKELYDTFAQKEGKTPYELPPEWVSGKSSLDPKVSFNFVSTNDIIGGNSGSPVVNRKGEIVGLIFDGNKESLIWDIAFDDTAGRSISVHSRAISYSLQKVYKAEPLVKELNQ